MRLKPKRRLILLISIVAVLAVGAFAAIFVRNWQRERITNRYLDQGLAAFAAGDYYEALGLCGQYYQRARRDPARRNDPRHAEAILAFAESRRKIEENDGRHLRECIPFYVQYLELRPDDRKAAMDLLQVYADCRFGVEAYELARRLRPSDLAKATAEDLTVMHFEAEACLRAKNYAALEAVAARILELNPLDLYANLNLVQADALRGTRDQARARADALLAAHPDAMAALIVAASSRQIEPNARDLEQALEWTCRAAGLDLRSGQRVADVEYPDVQHAYRIVLLLDALSAPRHTLQVLRHAVEKFNDRDLNTSLARRLWQEGEFDELLNRFGGIDPNAPDVDPELLGFVALASLDRKQADRVAAFEAALKKRGALGFRWSSWSRAIPLIDPDRAAKPVDAVESWKEIIKVNPHEPVFLAQLGEVYAALGRNEDARTFWKNTSNNLAASGWLLPRFRMAQTLLADGRPEEALEWANEAFRLGRNRVSAVALWFEVNSAAVQRGVRNAPDPRGVLAVLEEALAMIATEGDGEAVQALRERLIVPHVILLVHTGQRDKARELALTMIAKDPPPSVDTLQRLLATSRRENLDIEDACQQRIAALGAGTAADFAKAAELADSGRVDEAVALLNRAAAANPTDAAAQVAVPRLLERLGRPEALAEWIKVADAHPDNLGVQRACLQSEAIAADRAFVTRTIDRYRRLIGAADGEDDPVIVIATARMLMYGRPSRADRDRAIGILGELVTRQPRAVEPKQLLAAALTYARPPEIRPDLPRATAHLVDAAALDPRSTTIALQLAHLYQMQGDYARAREQLTRVAADAGLDPAVRRAAAEMLIAQGDAAGVALDTLVAMATEAGDRAPSSLLTLLAETYRILGREADANAVFERLAATASDPDAIYVTARHFANLGDRARADSVLARLDTLSLDPGLREMVLARTALDRGDAKVADENFAKAVAAAPKRVDFWRQYAGAALLHGRFADAAAIAKRGLDANPGDLGLESIARTSQALASGTLPPDVAAVLQALGVNPAAADALESITALIAAKPAGDFTAEELQSLADRFPTVIPLQLFVAKRLLGPSPRLAIAIAERAVRTAPLDPMPLKIAAEIYFALGQWEDLLRIARAWKTRERLDSPEPDLAIAEAFLRLRQPRPGLEALRSRVDRAAADPKGPFSLGVLNLYARLLVAAGRATEARDLLAPLLPSGPEFRTLVWLPIATDPALPLAEAEAWIEQARAAVPASQVREMLSVATSFYIIADRDKDQTDRLLRRGLTLIEELARSPGDAAPIVFETLGIVRHRMGDLTGAEDAYRRAIEASPNQPTALNNLASVMLEARGDLDAALELAKRAVAARATDSSLDTLISVYTRLAERRREAAKPAEAREFDRLAAEAWMQRARLAPDRPEYLMQAGTLADNAGSYELAVAAWEALISHERLSAEDGASARNNLAMDLARLNRSPADLERASRLIDEAIRTVPLSPFYDTKGWIELQRRQHAAAAAAFRRALELAQAEKAANPSAEYADAVVTASTIGLATALARGEAAEREEARRLLDGLAPPSDPENQERLKAARDALAG